MTHGFPWVTVLGLIPLIGVIGVLGVPREREEDAKRIALGASLVTLVGSIVMAAQFKTHGARFQFTQDYDWIKAFGAHYAVGVDGIALALILMTTVLTPVIILSSWHEAAPEPVVLPHPCTGVLRSPRLVLVLAPASSALGRAAVDRTETTRVRGRRGGRPDNRREQPQCGGENRALPSPDSRSGVSTRRHVALSVRADRRRVACGEPAVS